MRPFASVSEPIQALIGETKIIIVSLKHHGINEDAMIRQNEHAAVAKVASGGECRRPASWLSGLERNWSTSHLDIAIVGKYRDGF